MGLFCVTRSNRTHQLTDPTQPNPLQVGKFAPNPTQPNTTNSLVVTYFIHRTYLVLLVNQASTYSCSLLIIIILKAVSLCHSKTSFSKKPCFKCINIIFQTFSTFAIVTRGGGTASPYFFDRGDTSPTPPLFKLKFVQKLVHCCNWLLTETQCKIISVQQN